MREEKSEVGEGKEGRDKKGELGEGRLGEKRGEKPQRGAQSCGEEGGGVGKEKEGRKCFLFPEGQDPASSHSLWSCPHFIFCSLCQSFWPLSFHLAAPLWISCIALHDLLGRPVLLVDANKLEAVQCASCSSCTIYHGLPQHSITPRSTACPAGRHGHGHVWMIHKATSLHSAPLCSIFPAPGPPSFLAFSEITSTTLNVSWGEPSAANGILQGYRVVYEPLAPVQGKAWGAVVGSTPGYTERGWGGGVAASTCTASMRA